jgi:hypothetical protein
MDNNTIMSMMMQILKNQYVLLATSQMSNMSDMEHKAELFEAASKQASETRFLMDLIEKEMQQG